MAGESAFGGVSLVYQGDGSGEYLERAYAYSGYNKEEAGQEKYVETISWFADRSVTLHMYYASEDTMGTDTVLQFGFPRWQTGKLSKVRRYDKCGKTASEGDFAEKFLNIDSNGVYDFYTIDDIKSYLSLTGSKFLEEEESRYQNYDGGWQWLLPLAKCSGCANDSGYKQYDISSFYTEVIPAGDNYLPEWNTVLVEKITRIYNGNTIPLLTSKTEFIWGDIIGPTDSIYGGNWTEHNALLFEEKHYDYAAGNDTNNLIKTIAYEYENYWPSSHTAGLPARVIGLESKTVIYDAQNRRVAREQNLYHSGFSSLSDYQM